MRRKRCTALEAGFDRGGRVLSKINSVMIDAESLSVGHLPDLARLRYFLAVADCLSFREAAQRLNVAQPAISRAIRQLERELGFSVFERTTRKVVLTEAGAALRSGSAEALERLAVALRHAAQAAAGEAGELSLAYSAQAVHGPMAEIVVGFRSAMPNACIHLNLMSSQEQIPALESGRLDVGFLLSAACKSPLSHIVVARERFVVLVSKHDPLAGRASIALSELSERPFVIGTMRRWHSFRSLVNHACLSAGYLPRVVEEADDVPLLLQLVSLRKGVTLYGAAIGPTLLPDIAAVPVADEHATFDVSIAWNAARATPLLKAFIDFTRSHAAKGDAGAASPSP